MYTYIKGYDIPTNYPLIKDDCVYRISPELPYELKLNNITGEITGKAKITTNRIYYDYIVTAICNNNDYIMPISISVEDKIINENDIVLIDNSANIQYNNNISIIVGENYTFTLYIPLDSPNIIVNNLPKQMYFISKNLTLIGLIAKGGEYMYIYKYC